MSNTLFHNEYFKSEKFDDGSTVVTVLKDKHSFWGVDLTGCKFITDNGGYICDDFTESAKAQIKESCMNFKEIESEYKLRIELRCRMLTIFVGMAI